MLILIIIVILCNLYVAHTMTAEEMKFDFISNQGIVGIICANGFYAFAWVLKGIKTFVK
jgi:hypothetical protein